MFLERLNDFINRHYKATVTVLIVSSIIFAIITIVFFLMNHGIINTGATYISINVAPADAKIIIDGNEYRNGVYEFSPGTHNVQISSDGFSSKETTITAIANRTATLTEYLQSETDGLDIYERSAYEIDILSHIDSPETNSFVKDYEHKTAISEILPLKIDFKTAESETGKSYYMDAEITDGSYDVKCKYAFCLKINGYLDGQESMKTAIAQSLKEKGYDFSSYHVIYELE